MQRRFNLSKSVRWYISVIALIALCLTLCAGLLYGWLKGPPPPAEEDPVAQGEAAKSQEELFDLFIEGIFVDIVTSDSITLNYFLADPSAFNIKELTPGFGEVTSPETILKDRRENRELSETLMGFEYDMLRSDQQIIYDIIKHDLELYELLDSTDDRCYYLGAIRPLNGVQVQLPIILAEFNFYSVVDIEIYLQLLQDTNRYFDELIEFERERSRRGFFLSDANVDRVVEHCESFLEDPENNLMIIVFNDRINKYEGLSQVERDQYKQRNRDLVLGNVLPAYETLLAAMLELRGSGANPGGLAALPDGLDFASTYLRYHTGSDKTPEQVDSLLDNWMGKTYSDIWALLNGDPKLYDAYFNDSLGKISDETPERYLDDLEKSIARDFPDAGLINYSVREVHSSMQEHVSPAFFLVPAFDYFDDNVIYINPASISDNLSLFTTLAHEGYPGHMYQTVYFLKQLPHPLRTVIGDWGYTEGWATYVEFQSYYFTDLSEDSAALLKLVNLYDLLFITRIDLGVNALGWDQNELASFCHQFGITDRDVVEDVFNTVTGNPLLYLPYCLGYLESISLLEEAQSALGGDFALLEFHRFLLDFGPAPFPIIRAYMLDWIDAQPSASLAPAA